MARMTKDEIEQFFARLSAANPHPTTELEYTNVYTLLVAVVMSAQATDVGVNKATAELFKTVDTPAKMVALGEDALIGHIRTIGLFRNKAKNVIALSAQLLAEHGGEVPADRAALEALPGVGRKTANVVLNTAFGEPTSRATSASTLSPSITLGSRPRRSGGCGRTWSLTPPSTCRPGMPNASARLSWLPATDQALAVDSA